MKTKILTGALALALAVVAPYSSQAKKREATQPMYSPAPSHAMTSPSPLASKAQRPLPFHGRISVIDAHGKKFALVSRAGTGRTFVITDQTLISKLGNRAKFSDLAKGEEIRGSYWKRPDGTLEVKTLRVGPPTVAEKQAKEHLKTRVKEKAAEKKSQY